MNEELEQLERAITAALNKMQTQLDALERELETAERRLSESAEQIKNLKSGM